MANFMKKRAPYGGWSVGFWFVNKYGQRVFTRRKSARAGYSVGRARTVYNFSCVGCGVCFNRRRGLHQHQGNLWPFCLSTAKL